MKNDNTQITRQYTPRRLAISTDILVRADVVESNAKKVQLSSRRKRRIDYAKKILNDPMIFTV